MSVRERIAVVGGGPAGLAVARAYREAGGRAELVLLAEEPHLPYLRPPLTKEYLREETTREGLPIERASFYAEREIEVRLGTHVSGLDPDERMLVTAEGEEISYDHCVLATGSRPLRLPVPGGEDPDLVLVRTVESSDALRAAGSEGARVVVIGSGFIGCEAAVSLAMRGARVVLASDEDAPQARRLGEEAAGELLGWLHEAGVETRLGASVERIDRDAAGSFSVRLGADGVLEADAVVCATGIGPRIELAERAGLALEQGAVAVDASMHSGIERHWAVGDVAAAVNATAGRRLRVEHWGDAIGHGEVAGRALAGEETLWTQVPGFWSVVGSRTLKYAAWGEGFDEVRFDRRGGGFTAWYGLEGTTVGVLTHERDEDYEHGSELVAAAMPLP